MGKRAASHDGATSDAASGYYCPGRGMVETQLPVSPPVPPLREGERRVSELEARLEALTHLAAPEVREALQKHDALIEKLQDRIEKLEAQVARLQPRKP